MEQGTKFKMFKKYVGIDNIVYQYVGIVKGRKNFMRLPFNNGERIVPIRTVILTNNQILGLNLIETN